jgi:hypothetical protein
MVGVCDSLNINRVDADLFLFFRFDFYTFKLKALTVNEGLAIFKIFTFGGQQPIAVAPIPSFFGSPGR